MSKAKPLSELHRELAQILEAIIARWLAVSHAYPVDFRKGMLPISHTEHFARLKQILEGDEILAGLHRQYELADKAIANGGRNPRRPPQAKRAGAALRITWPTADAIGTRCAR